ncbi:ABC transporter permease [Streptomyces sp. NPDC057702]|uniref:ABC transporter permease n=1 Tax=unclassified Streptomyces TaxID=2593676 RepID=UPI0036A9AE8B
MNGHRATARLALASLRAHRRRFAGTFVAVLLGVAFLGGTLVMGDTLRASFDTLFGNATSGTDAVVRGANAITTPGNAAGTREPVPTSLTRALERVDGVAAAEPTIQGAGQLVGKDGEGIGGKGPPTLAGNWIADPDLNAYRLTAGRAPRAPGEAVINRGAAKAGDLAIGDTTVLRTPEPLPIRIVGLASFGGEDGMGQVTFTGLTRADAERHLTARPGRAASIQVRARPGVSQRDLVERLERVLPRGVEAITGEQSAEENLDQISGTFLTMFTALLLVFAGIALLVATFSIHNTFAIVVAQRTRENALLRALGAARRQVMAGALLEASAVGVLASLVGLLGGIGLAAGLGALFPAVGFPFPEGDLVVRPLSWALPLAVGVLVCVGSALSPALRAGRTAPLAALRESAVDHSGASRTRALGGVALGAAGIGGTAWAALAGEPSMTLTAVGAVATLAAFVVLGPVACTLVVRVLSGPLGALRGISGALAGRNALRGPQRTAATATALMIGVTVVSLFTVFAASLKATLNDTVARTFAGDVAVSVPAFGGGGAGLSPTLAPALDRLLEVDTALGLGRGVAKVDGAGGRELTVTDPAALSAVLDLGTIRGALADLGPTGLAVSASEAGAHRWRVGSRVGLAFTDGARQTFTVRAVYEEKDLAGDYLITRQAWAPHRTQDADTLIAVSFRDGVPTSEGKRAVERVAERRGDPEVQTRQEWAASSAGGIDMMLTLVYALLALAVLIALLGIANTLTLAVHERTRELGLLRAVGQTRAQLRAMVRWEAVLVAAFGTLGGLTLGGFLGWALVRVTASAGEGTFALPPLPLAVVALVGVSAGALAALRPARRAARLDVLRALATD